jgi:hypothetical protein
MVSKGLKIDLQVALQNKRGGAVPKVGDGEELIEEYKIIYLDAIRDSRNDAPAPRLTILVNNHLPDPTRQLLMCMQRHANGSPVGTIHRHRRHRAPLQLEATIPLVRDGTGSGDGEVVDGIA